jgi:hypothetical protein
MNLRINSSWKEKRQADIPQTRKLNVPAVRKQIFHEVSSNEADIAETL